MHLRGSGVRVGIGHTATSAEVIRDAVKAGATLSTHLGNGSAQMIPRHPNFIWEQLAADELTASLIVDGHHLPPATVKTMIRAKGVRRTILVTDAMAATGQPPGEYQLGSVKARLDETGRVAIPGSPGLAGSALAIDRAVANTVRFAVVTIEGALAMASTNPAAYLGITPAGTLELEWEAETCTLGQVRLVPGSVGEAPGTEEKAAELEAKAKEVAAKMQAQAAPEEEPEDEDEAEGEMKSVIIVPLDAEIIAAIAATNGHGRVYA